MTYSPPMVNWFGNAFVGVGVLWAFGALCVNWAVAQIVAPGMPPGGFTVVNQPSPNPASGPMYTIFIGVATLILNSWLQDRKSSRDTDRRFDQLASDSGRMIEEAKKEAIAAKLEAERKIEDAKAEADRKIEETKKEGDRKAAEQDIRIGLLSKQLDDAEQREREASLRRHDQMDHINGIVGAVNLQTRDNTEAINANTSSIKGIAERAGIPDVHVIEHLDPLKYDRLLSPAAPFFSTPIPPKIEETPDAHPDPRRDRD